MDPLNMLADRVKQEILRKVEEFYSLQHTNRDFFVSGKTRVPCAGRVFDEKDLVSLVDASLEFWLTQGRFTDAFEDGLANFLGAKHCIFVNSGSSANLLAFMALTSDKLGPRQIKPLDEVITVSAAFPTTVSPVIQYGAVPVFVDIEARTYNIDPLMLQGALSDRTKAVFVAHCMGHPFDVDKVRGFCDEHNLWLIEDNCDALGARYKGAFTGTFGQLSTSSFYPAHQMTTGEGGAIFTNDAELARIVRSLRDWGRDCWCASGHDNTCGKRFDRQFGELPFGYDHKYVYIPFRIQPQGHGPASSHRMRTASKVGIVHTEASRKPRSTPRGPCATGKVFHSAGGCTGYRAQLVRICDDRKGIRWLYQGRRGAVSGKQKHPDPHALCRKSSQTSVLHRHQR